jgi:hypothetical protein
MRYSQVHRAVTVREAGASLGHVAGAPGGKGHTSTVPEVAQLRCTPGHPYTQNGVPERNVVWTPSRASPRSWGISFPNTGGPTVFSCTLSASLHRPWSLGKRGSEIYVSCSASTVDITRQHGWQYTTFSCVRQSRVDDTEQKRSGPEQVLLSAAIYDGGDDGI